MRVVHFFPAVVMLAGLGLVSLHDVVAKIRVFGHLIQILFFLYGIDLFVPLEGLSLGLEEIVTVGLEMVIDCSIAEALALAVDCLLTLPL